MEDNQGKENIHWRSEFNMALADMQRIDKIKQALDEYCYLVRIKDFNSLSYLRPYFSTLEALFVNIQPIMDDKKKDFFAGLFRTAEKAISQTFQLSKGNKVFIQAHEALYKIHADLLNHMQDRGMGIPVSRKLSGKVKLRNALRGGIRD